MAHAILSPSSAARWLACPPSARLEAEVPDQSSEAAEEGTAAHKLAEIIIKYNAGETKKRTFNTQLKKFQDTNEYYSAEMMEYIKDYTETIWEKFNEAKSKTKDAVLLSEHQVDLSDYVPECFGTVDVTIIADGTMEIVDLKYGKGVKVSAINNPQLRMYALGAVVENELLYDIRRVRMTIIQPRINNISSQEMTVEELEAWGTDVLMPAAKLAFKGEGEFCPGEDQCRFCKIKATCRARAEKNLSAVRDDFAMPPTLTNDDVAELLPKLDEIATWAKDLQTYALDQALKGVQFEGYKLVEGRSVRKYVDEDKVAEAVIRDGWAEDDIYKRKLIGITDMEKLLGKKHFAEVAGDLVEKPTGKPALVPESDKRPALDSAEDAIKDFRR